MNATRTARYFLIAPHSIANADGVGRVIEKALQKTGFHSVSSESSTQYGDRPIGENVLRSIERADLIIADLTGRNPNVMYELGFAHALRKPVLFILQEGSGDIPDQVKGNLFVAYDPTKPDELDTWIRAGAALYLPNRNKASIDE